MYEATGCDPWCAGCKHPDEMDIHRGSYRCSVRDCDHMITHYYGTRADQTELFCVRHDPRGLTRYHRRPHA